MLKPRAASKLFSLLLGSLLLTACAAGRPTSPTMLLERKGIGVQSAQSFTYCHGYGCNERVELAYSAAELEGLKAFFVPEPESAQAERRVIAGAVGYLERINAPKAGTTADVGGTFTGFGEPGQLDCEDEAVNTTTALMLLRDLRLIRFHRLRAQVTRGFFFRGWPHTSAAVVEEASGAVYVIDSWFGSSGEQPHVVPYDLWAAGWDPARDGPVPEEQR